MILKILGYILLFLIITFLIYWYKIHERSKKDNYWKEHNDFIDIFMIFMFQLIMTPVSFILGVYGIKTFNYPDGV